MKRSYKFLFVILGLATLVSKPSPAAATPQSEKTRLTSDQKQLYGDFVEPFSKMNFRFLSNRTFALELSSIGKDAACLRGLQFSDSAKLSNIAHTLDSEVLRGQSIRLVSERQKSAIVEQRDADVAAHGAESMLDATGMTKDPGVLALSEILFDTNHHSAVLKYLFLCGSHCNSGAIIVLEKVGSRWTATTRRPCSVVVNNEHPRQ